MFSDWLMNKSEYIFHCRCCFIIFSTMKHQSNKEKKPISNFPATKSALPSLRKSPRNHLGTPKVICEDTNDAIFAQASERDLISGISIDLEDDFHDAINADKEIISSFLEEAATLFNHPHTVAIKQSQLTARTKGWNYTRDKDIALCRAFINLSANSIERTEKPRHLLAGCTQVIWWVDG